MFGVDAGVLGGGGAALAVAALVCGDVHRDDGALRPVEATIEQRQNTCPQVKVAVGYGSHAFLQYGITLGNGRLPGRWDVQVKFSSAGCQHTKDDADATSAP